MPVQVFVAEQDGKRFGSAAVCLSDDRIWVFLDVERSLSRGAVTALMRAMQDGLIETNRVIHTACNIAHASAPRLLALLGFTPTDEIRDGYPVWVWQPMISDV